MFWNLSFLEYTENDWVANLKVMYTKLPHIKKLGDCSLQVTSRVTLTYHQSCHQALQIFHHYNPLLDVDFLISWTSWIYHLIHCYILNSDFCKIFPFISFPANTTTKLFLLGLFHLCVVKYGTWDCLIG